MTITLTLPAEVVRRLEEEAARRGLGIESYLERLAEQSLTKTPAENVLSAENWEAEWRAWAASHPRLPAPVDDDREGIYAGRGE